MFIRHLSLLIVTLFVISTANAGYTSEETDEKTKSLYNAVTSILSSSDSSKHHHKHTYDSPPCSSGACPGAVSPCSSSTGCPIGYTVNQGSASSSNVYGGYEPSSVGHGNLPTTYPVSPQPQPYPNSPTGYNHPNSGYGSTYPVPPPPQPYPAPAVAYNHPNSGIGSPNTLPAYSNTGYSQPGAPVPPYAQYGGYAQSSSQLPPYVQQGGYIQPNAPAPYAHGHRAPSHYGYQKPRGYSVHDHSLKINSEYTETGTHTGPLQRGSNGYGSGYGGGYNGLYNRPFTGY